MGGERTKKSLLGEDRSRRHSSPLSMAIRHLSGTPTFRKPSSWAATRTPRRRASTGTEKLAHKTMPLETSCAMTPRTAKNWKWCPRASNAYRPYAFNGATMSDGATTPKNGATMERGRSRTCTSALHRQASDARRPGRAHRDECYLGINRQPRRSRKVFWTGRMTPRGCASRHPARTVTDGDSLSARLTNSGFAD